MLGTNTPHGLIPLRKEINTVLESKYCDTIYSYVIHVQAQI